MRQVVHNALEKKSFTVTFKAEKLFDIEVVGWTTLHENPSEQPETVNGAKDGQVESDADLHGHRIVTI